MKQIFLLFILFFYGFGNDYEAWLKKEQEKFSTFKTTHDEEFNQALKKDWASFKASYSSTPYAQPKPTTLPNIKSELKLKPTLVKNSPIVELKKISLQKIPKKIVPIKESDLFKKSKDTSSFKTINFDFYSNKVALQYNPQIDFLITSVSKEAISNFWERFTKTNNTELIAQIQSHIKQYQLNDWATYLFIHKIGMEIYQLENMANLFSWYILTQMNYDIKVGYTSTKIYLLANMQHKLFQVAFLTLKGKPYYVLTPQGKISSINSIYTYEATHKKAQYPLSFEFKEPLLLNTRYANKTLNFTYNEEIHTLKSDYSIDLVEFYKTFPQSDYNIYFNANNSSYLEQTLLPQLQKLIINKTEVEAVNILLRFVQTAFKYQTDKEQFNYEKVFFPEETLFYSYSDCEDRTILFTYLIKHLLNLDIVGVKYKDHIATAVKLSSKNNLDGFVHNKSYYTIADPTYINANIGMTMPKYINQPFDIID